MCVNWFRVQYPNLFIFAVPNGGSRHKLEAINIKREGAVSGVSDLIVLLDKGKSLLIEMKKPVSKRYNPATGKWNKVQGGKQSESQKSFQIICEKLNHKYFVCNSFDMFKDIINSNVK